MPVVIDYQRNCCELSECNRCINSYGLQWWHCLGKAQIGWQANLTWRVEDNANKYIENISNKVLSGETS